MSKHTDPTGDPPSISDTEMEVLEELWRTGGSSPTELQARFEARRRPLAYTTVQTFLHRLFDKGFVERERRGRTWVYRVPFSREDFVFGQAHRLSRRLLGGKPSALVFSLVQSGKLTRREIARLKKALDDAEERG